MEIKFRLRDSDRWQSLDSDGLRAIVTAPLVVIGAVAVLAAMVLLAATLLP